MLRILGRLRRELVTERQFGSYFRYAVGEIVLIVLGIVVALQLNDWNDERLRQQQVRAYAQALATDLAEDVKMLVPVDGQIRVIMRQADELANYLRGRPIEDISNAEVFFLTFNVSGYRPYAWNRTAIEQLKTTGALREMQNQRLARQVAAYDALTHHLDQDFAGDVAMVGASRAMVNRVRNLNYPNIGQALGYFAQVPDDDTELAFFAFRESPIFVRMVAEQLALLTRDPADVAVMVNEAIEIRDAIRPRVEVEFPRLKQLAEQIQVGIAAEYP